MLELGLTDAAFRARLAAFVAETGLDDPREWTRRIVVDRANWPLSFHRWPLRETTETEAVRITVDELSLPRVGEQPEHATIRCWRTWSASRSCVAGPAGTEPASGQLRRPAGPASHPRPRPVHRADRLRGLRPHRRSSPR